MKMIIYLQKVNKSPIYIFRSTFHLLVAAWLVETAVRVEIQVSAGHENAACEDVRVDDAESKLINF